MHAAYDALPGDLRDQIASMKTHNKIEDYNYVNATDKERFGAVQVHPLVRTHPVTGKKALYIHPGKTEKLEGMTPSQSRTFVDSLMTRIIQPEISYRHKWRKGDLVIMDNRALLHIAFRDYDPSEGRIMHRVILQGEVPV